MVVADKEEDAGLADKEAEDREAEDEEAADMEAADKEAADEEEDAGVAEKEAADKDATDEEAVVDEVEAMVDVLVVETDLETGLVRFAQIQTLLGEMSVTSARDQRLIVLEEEVAVKMAEDMVEVALGADKGMEEATEGAGV